jgi:hypothetical protein
MEDTSEDTCSTLRLSDKSGTFNDMGKVTCLPWERNRRFLFSRRRNTGMHGGFKPCTDSSQLVARIECKFPGFPSFSLSPGQDSTQTSFCFSPKTSQSRRCRNFPPDQHVQAINITEVLRAMNRVQNPESSLLESSPIINTMAPDGKACFLQALPRELLLTICEEVFGDEYDRDTGSLARMARTCRFLNRVATPMLYRDIRHPECRLDPTNPNDIGIDNLAVFEKNLHLFLALHNNPALGPTIRAMRVAPPYLHAEFPPYYTSLTLNNLKVYRTEISKLFDIDPRSSTNTTTCCRPWG